MRLFIVLFFLLLPLLLISLAVASIAAVVAKPCLRVCMCVCARVCVCVVAVNRMAIVEPLRASDCRLMRRRRATSCRRSRRCRRRKQWISASTTICRQCETRRRASSVRLRFAAARDTPYYSARVFAPRRQRCARSSAVGPTRKLALSTRRRDARGDLRLRWYPGAAVTSRRRGDAFIFLVGHNTAVSTPLCAVAATISPSRDRESELPIGACAARRATQLPVTGALAAAVSRWKTLSPPGEWITSHAESKTSSCARDSV